MSTITKATKTETSSTQNQFVSSLLKYSQQITILFFLAVSIYLTAVSNDFLLKYIEEFSLFSPTINYFNNCMNFAGGLLTYVGTFLTQFLFSPILGSFIFIAILFLVQYLSVIAFRIPKHYYPLSFIPGLMLLLSVTQLGYIWLTLKSPGYFFSNSLGVITFLSFFILYRSFSNLILRIGTLIITLTIGYSLFGFYALFAGLICLLYEFISYLKDRKHSRLIPVSIGLALIILVPQICYYYIYYEMQFIDIYIAGLPHFEFNLTELVLWIPFLILFASFLMFLYFLFSKPDDGAVRKRPFIVSSSVFVSAIVFISCMSYSDINFTAGVKMYNAIERNDWEKVIAIAQNLHGKPTKNIVLSYRMATLLTFHAASNDKELTRENTIAPNCIRESMPLKVQLGGISFYYNSGEINKCYRLCMENAVEFGMRVAYLKYMVKCSIVNEEYELARKYNALLLSSMFHKQWALRYQELIDHPEMTKNDSEIKIIRSMSEANEQDFEQL